MAYAGNDPVWLFRQVARVPLTHATWRPPDALCKGSDGAVVHQKFDVEGMTCAACQAHVEKAVTKLDGVSGVAVNLLSGSMAVDYDESQVSADEICSAVDRAGYSAAPQPGQSGVGWRWPGHPARTVPGAPAHADLRPPARLALCVSRAPPRKLEAAARKMRTRLIVSIVFLVPLFYLGMGHMFNWPLPGFFTGDTHVMNFCLTMLFAGDPHHLCKPRLLRQRVQVADPRRAQHGHAHRGGRGGLACLFRVCAVRGERRAWRRPGPCRSRVCHEQPVPRERRHDPRPGDRREIPRDAQQVKDWRRHRAPHRPRP